ncbi:PAS domain-containing protein [Pseudomonas duriflava]|uniref:histidine kinase n=1 Tax=Pseudomonas duriflava TaxID=459528 RepID=A0A562QPJ1_9PSED|nr:ATP-binding protein [Pseudomonas duriflava]TWI58669.1 PAS domain-containing protein [Pseudomonas duriflava]
MERLPVQVLGALAERIDLGIIVFDADMNILHWNAFITLHSGKQLKDAQGRAFTEVFPEAACVKFAQVVSQAVESSTHVYTHWVEAPLLRLDNPAIALQNTIFFPFIGSDGARMYGLILQESNAIASSTNSLEAALNSLRNKQDEQDQLLRKLEVANSQLLQSEKLAAIGQLAAGVAHEINNPIGYVFSNLKTLGGYVHDLLRIIDAVDNVSSLDELRNIKHSLEYNYIRSDIEAVISESEDGIDRVKRIIGALKDFSHIDEEEFRPVSLHRGIDTTLNVVNNELKYKAEVIKEYGDLPDVECIPSQINQVVMNLLVNAAHSIEQFGRITIRSRQEDSWVWLEVEDTGKGIEAKILNRIFEPFFTTKPIGKGTGLGLALSYTIIQKHHGRIEVFSEVGKGTRFRVWLPIKQTAEASQVEVQTL